MVNGKARPGFVMKRQRYGEGRFGFMEVVIV
jgi:hypothetical protein